MSETPMTPPQTPCGRAVIPATSRSIGPIQQMPGNISIPADGEATPAPRQTTARSKRFIRTSIEGWRPPTHLPSATIGRLRRSKKGKIDDRRRSPMVLYPTKAWIGQFDVAASFLMRSGLVEESLAGKTYTCGITAPAHGKWELFPVLSRLKVQAKILSYFPPSAVSDQRSISMRRGFGRSGCWAGPFRSCWPT